MFKVNIKDKLQEKGLNKNQFAKLIQIGYPAACALHDGSTARISFETLEKICIVLECTPNDILTSDDPLMQKFFLVNNIIHIYIVLAIHIIYQL